MRNKDPFEPWNGPVLRDDPFAPHNDVIKRNDPFQPWHDPVGREKTLILKIVITTKNSVN